MNENIEAKIRFLEMIQGIMTRMSSNSFMLKGWAVTLVAGIFVLADRDSNPLYFLIAYVPAVLFWFLDSYYLMLERQYKHFYEIVTGKKPDKIDFVISRPASNRTKKTCFDQCLFSTTEWLFYVPMALLVTGVVVLGALA